MRLEDLRHHRTVILELANAYGASNVRVFGSVARGEATAMSDVDLLVEVAPGKSLLTLGGLSVELQDVLACKVDIATEKMLKDRTREQVLREAVPL